MPATPPPTDVMRAVNELLARGAFQEAHEKLAQVVAEHPQYPEALRLFAGTKQALGDAGGAEQLLHQAMQLDPAWTPTLATLGELLLGSGRVREAETLLRRAATGQPPISRAALLLARLYNDSGRPEEAVTIAAPFCASGTLDADLTAQHVTALIALGRAPEAVAGYRRVLAQAPNSPGAAQALALTLNMTGQPAEGARVAQALLGRGHRSAALYLTLARSLIAQGERIPAEEALRECLRLEPRMVDAHNHLAQLVWMRSGSLTQATETLDEVLRAHGRDESLWAAKAALLQGAGDARGAYDCLAAWAERPEAAPALLLRASLAALQFASAKALALAERASRLMPQAVAAQTVLAAACLGVGDARAALARCEALLPGSPDDQYLIALQTTAWRMLGDERYAQLCDYPSLVVPLQLEAPAPWSDMDSFLTQLRNSLNRLHDPQGHALLFQSLRNGTETTQDLSRSADAAIRGLFEAFREPINRYLARIGTGRDPLRRRNGARWRFNGSWSVRLRTLGYHTNHVHPRGWISSACYIELPEDMGAADEQGALTFGEPGIVTTPVLAAQYRVRPKVGTLVLFPSYFWHGTVPFRSSQPRLTVAFDAVPER